MGENVEREKWNEKYYCIVFRTACDDTRELHVDSCSSNDGEKAVSDFISSVFNHYCIFSSSDYLHSDCRIFVGSIREKKILLPCLLIAGLGGLVAAVASTFMKNPYAMILAGRVLQGIGSAGAAPIVMPFIGDLFQGDDEKVSAGLGDIETANTSGKVLSPILGALLASWYWFVPFWFIPFFCLISFLLVLFLVAKPEEDEDAPAVSEFIKSVRKIFKQDGRWLYTVFIIGCVIMFLLFGVLFYLSDTLENKYAIDGVAKGGLLAIPLLFLSTSSFIAGKKIGKDKGRMKFCVVTGMILLTLSFIALWWNHSFYFYLSF